MFKRSVGRTEQARGPHVARGPRVENHCIIQSGMMISSLHRRLMGGASVQLIEGLSIHQ